MRGSHTWRGICITEVAGTEDCARPSVMVCFRATELRFTTGALLVYSFGSCRNAVDGERDGCCVTMRCIYAYVDEHHTHTHVF